MSTRDVSTFKFECVIARTPDRQLIALQGCFGSERAVLVLTKHLLGNEKIEELITGMKTDLKTYSGNDKYAKVVAYSNTEIWNGFEVQIICPANDDVIKKYQAYNMKRVWINETADVYTRIVKPILDNYNASRSVEWIYNILEKKKEQELTIYEDPDAEIGFILQYGYLWEDRADLDSMVLLCFANKRGIQSLRDLKPEHVPMLENVLEKGLQAIEDILKVKREYVRAYIHYQPSFYHLHMHFTNTQVIKQGSEVERAHLIQDVIDNIKLVPDYYQRKTLYYTLPQTHDIVDAINKQNFYL